MHIALFGIAGSGKSTLTKELVSTNPEYVGLSASALLKQIGRPIEISKIGSDSLSINQQQLITAYTSLKQAIAHTIVEFHAVIETENNDFWVPIAALRQLNPDLIFFINAIPADIFYRRTHDKSKVRKIISKPEISKLQTMALLHLTRAYGSDKLIIVSNSNAFKLISEAITRGKQ
ncbi:AAA family ATPase [Pseudomonas putida]|uniref:AAA family ATPase n=1 Tax=Pseudomonas putida TaxID=303 RepID=A0AAW4C2G1_PSEPU|nr:AAA family ATPase [Pseudomonas putida]MBF8704623.1 AAA family ATPase [Pseudomonas putida]MBF8738852.1 AAA family ATPase [Pseudomonas putida]